jgi:hypothetical protein
VMIRQQAGLSVERLCALAGIPRPTWYRRRRRVLGGAPAKGPVAAPRRRASWRSCTRTP